MSHLDIVQLDNVITVTNRLPQDLLEARRSNFRYSQQDRRRTICTGNCLTTIALIVISLITIITIAFIFGLGQ